MHSQHVYSCATKLGVVQSACSAGLNVINLLTLFLIAPFSAGEHQTLRLPSLRPDAFVSGNPCAEGGQLSPAQQPEWTLGACFEH